MNLSATTENHQKEFACSLYREHLEEASFLYQQRLFLLNNPEFTWTDIESFENRFEAHIDALLIGGELALNVCKQQATNGDSGELHTAVRVCCRHGRMEWVKELLESSDPQDEEAIQAAADALKHEMPANWQPELLRMLSDEKNKSLPVIIRVAGYRRMSAGKELLNLLQKNPADSLPLIIWAAGRIREQTAIPIMLNYLRHEDESICFDAALALLRMGELHAFRECLHFISSQDWPFLFLGLGGTSSTISILNQIAATDRVNADCIMALGLAGNIEAINTLMNHLGNPELAEYSAIALNLITGAELYENIFIPEKMDEDELFEEEIQKLKQDESLYPTGEEPGAAVSRLSQNPADWQIWWGKNKSCFKPGIRYRNGKRYSPACLIENLKSEKSPRMVRQLAYEELVIRYNIDFPFETDMFVVNQRQAILKYEEWERANQSRFQDGKWYFSGQIQF